MTEILIFGGTTEGRILYQKCRELGISALVCVATEYGAHILKEAHPDPAEDETARIRTGRLEQEQMVSLLLKEQPAFVIDATHPYASLASESIKGACRQTGKALIRIRREILPATFNVKTTEESCRYFADMKDMVGFLKEQDGNILATTGSKDIQWYTGMKEYRKRLYVRILPAPENLEKCLSCGIEGSHIIAMQGPFSAKMNEALLREYQIAWMTTKISGRVGGFEEKVEGAKRAGVKLLCILPPGDSRGLLLEEALHLLEERSYGENN